MRLSQEWLLREHVKTVAMKQRPAANAASIARNWSATGASATSTGCSHGKTPEQMANNEIPWEEPVATLNQKLGEAQERLAETSVNDTFWYRYWEGYCHALRYLIEDGESAG